MSTLMSVAQTARHEMAGSRGQLVGPGDEDYEDARNVYNAMIDRRPALISRCAGSDDVLRTVEFARDHGLLLAIRGGGHNGAGLGTCEDGVVIDLALLKTVDVDPRATTVRVGGGCTSVRSTRPQTCSASPLRAGSSPQPVSAGSRSAAVSAI
jgi:FAD binding domain